ncbi:MAG: hypothetical protein H6Q13_3482 [Bacteroidetes bacterium]|nr:hypothetical protein [Bacteroidota bacterium]
MNNIGKWLMIATIFTSCADDNGLSPTPSPEPASNGVVMNVAATVTPLVEVSTRAKILSFSEGNTIGVFYNDTCVNKPFIYQTSSWSGNKINLDETLKNVYAYFPYDKANTNLAAIPVGISAQNDVLFGTAIVSKAAPDANFAMKHALSLVRVVIKKNDYTGAGVINSVTWNNISTTATMDCTTGNLANMGTTGTLQAGGGYTLDDSKDPVAIEAIVLPVTSAKGISLVVNVDGKLRTYNISETHSFEQGKAYTYTLLLTSEYNTAVTLDECDVNVTYWSTFGKDDTVNLGTSDTDFFAVSPSVRDGADTYRMEGKDMGFLGYWTGFNAATGEMPATWEGDFRMVLLDSKGNIIDKYQPCAITVKNGEMMKGTGRRSFVTAPAGTYELSALFRKKGETTWIKAERKDGVTANDMAVYVYEKTTLPAVRGVQVDGEYNDGVLVYNRPHGESFSITYILSNRSDIAIKGEIKAVWERTFEYKGNTFRPCQKRSDTVNDDQWQDEIGRVRVDLTSDIRFWKGIISCSFPVKREAPKTTAGVIYCTPLVHLYYKADGTSEWKLLRQDCDPLLAAEVTTSQQEGALYVLTNNYVSLNQTHWVR